MKVILLTNETRFGNEGDVVEVKDGYGRNYLVPRGLALVATKDNFKRLEDFKRAKLKSQERVRDSAAVLKERLEGLSLTFTAEVKDGEEIFGSVSEAAILKMLEDEKIVLEKGTIVLEEPIKKLGVYTVKVKVHPEVQADLRVWVVKK